MNDLLPTVFVVSLFVAYTALLVTLVYWIIRGRLRARMKHKNQIPHEHAARNRSLSSVERH